MSLLPQRKKSTTEIAKLRESLGIPILPPDQTPAPVNPVTETAFPTPPPAPPRDGPKQVHSLKRSERIPSVPLDPPEPAAPLAAVTTLPIPGLKRVRSLRKSEYRAPPVTRQNGPPADSNLPSHRHSDEQLQAMRRREALALLTPVVHPQFVAAHPALLVPGYVCALIGAGAICFYQQPVTVSAPCAAASLLIAGFIALRKPLSRHHAAFITVITLFVIVFGVLHYFPQLRHAT